MFVIIIHYIIYLRVESSNISGSFIEKSISRRDLITKGLIPCPLGRKTGGVGRASALKKGVKKG
jgi:hypothetical protein